MSSGRLPSVDYFLNEEKIKQLLENISPTNLVVDLIRENLACCRAFISRGNKSPALSEIVENILQSGARP